MKFDKFMNFCFKGLCLCLTCIIIGGFCVSCFGSSVKAHAEGEEILIPAAQFAEDFNDQMIEINRRVAEDVRSSELSTEQKEKILKVLLVQELALQSMEGVYSDPLAPPTLNTVHFSGTGASGFYFREDGGDPILCNLYACKAGQILATSEDISLRFSFHQASMNANTEEYYNDNSKRIGLRYIGGTYYTQGDFVDSKGYLSDYTATHNWFTNDTVTVTFGVSYIPVIRRGTRADSLYLGQGVSVSIPADDVDIITPWDYYNNTVLPTIRTDYPTVPDIYIAYPYGYSVPDPTEPPTLPNGGIYIDKQFNIGINIITPTDSNGQPFTDASGETVTETVYVTESYPPDGDYRFQIPTLDTLTMYQATVPNPDISTFTGGFAFIWNCVDHFFNDTGFMPVVIACLSISVLSYIMWKVGS